jgi:hypothetical protein
MNEPRTMLIPTFYSHSALHEINDSRIELGVISKLHSIAVQPLLGPYTLHMGNNSLGQSDEYGVCRIYQGTYANVLREQPMILSDLRIQFTDPERLKYISTMLTSGAGISDVELNHGRLKVKVTATERNLLMVYEDHAILRWLQHQSRVQEYN